MCYGTRHPRELGPRHVEQYLTHLTTRREVAASTQNQALSTLVFLYQEVLKMELGKLEGFTRAKRPEWLPVVLTREEVQAILVTCSAAGASA